MIREKILSCLHDEDDDENVDALAKIIEEHGQAACKELFDILTHLRLGASEATQCWEEVLEHRKALGKTLGRSVTLSTVICDYFCSIHKAISNPKIVEIHVFEKTIKDSQYDRLTDLLNRRTFDEAFASEISRAKRYHLNVSVLFLDLDNFKGINDKYGHHAGDQILINVARIIKEEKRVEDIAGRYGGEEIIIDLPETDRLDALLLGERIRKKVEDFSIDMDGNKLGLTLSGGIASYPFNALDMATLMKKADVALYQAKGAGKNTIALFSPDKRKYTRIDLNKEIKIKQLDFSQRDHHVVVSKDISVGGVLFQHEAPLEIDSKIELSIPLDNNQPLYVIGTVALVESLLDGSYDIGITISFLEMDKETKIEISKYLSHELGSDSAVKSILLEGQSGLCVRRRTVS